MNDEFKSLFPGEKENINKVIDIAEIYGYGNLIAHLRRAWAIKLIKSNPLLDYKSALECTNSDGYPREAISPEAQ
jgi:dissimilatory sulfite reductase (desulfoviridin) alpha/beta subunit